MAALEAIGGMAGSGGQGRKCSPAERGCFWAPAAPARPAVARLIVAADIVIFQGERVNQAADPVRPASVQRVRG